MILYKKTISPIFTVSITCSMNNTIACIINSQGQVLYSLSCGHLKYRGSKKGSQIASQQVVSHLGKRALGLGYINCSVIIKGIGKGRNLIVKELIKVGLVVVKVIDKTSVAFNGCRIKKVKN